MHRKECFFHCRLLRPLDAIAMPTSTHALPRKTQTVLALLFSCAAAAQTPLEQVDTREQQRQLQRNQQLQQQQDNSVDVRLPASNPTPAVRYRAEPPPCFVIGDVRLTGDDAGRFEWALAAADKDSQDAEDPLAGRCVGTQGINLAISRVQNAILARGFITTRVLAAPQNLATGQLVLTLVPGRIRAIRYAQPQDARAHAANALPMQAGDLLNLRDIEQGLENLKRVPTADADIRIEPASGEQAGPGDSDLVIQWQQAKPYRLSFSADDGGSQGTGLYQGSVTLSYDHLFTLNDLFYLTHSQDLGGGADGERGSQSDTWHYSLPLGYWLLTYTGSQSRYHQQVAGASQTYQYSGKSDSSELKLSRVIYRDAVRKTTLSLKGWERGSSNQIDDTEIEVQRRRMAGWELGASHREFIGPATLDLNLAYRRGTGARNAMPAPEEAFGEGSSRPRLYLADAQLDAPFSLGAQKLRYNLAWRAQWNRNPLVPQDRFAIGSRYTVRGYNGESQLSAERGWFVRNELGWQLAGQELYLGYDYGRVAGPSASLLLGQRLAGATLGVRGKAARLGYDMFVSHPYGQPAYLRTPRTTGGFSLNLQY
jgi:hemolysin activation/secretion protein